MTDKPRLLDLFCGAGGAAKGYQRAGFYVVGVDIKPQPHYCGDEFYQADALEFAALHGAEFDAIHASPPCQAFTKYKNRRPYLPEKYPNLINAVRALLQSIGNLWVLENVVGSPVNGMIMLCGSMFSLDIRRHRLFESSHFILTPPCNHAIWQENRYPGGRSKERGNARILARATCEIGRWNIPLKAQYTAMGGCEWMNVKEISEAIPPAYTEYIGKYLMQQIENMVVAA